jgi:SPP1 gp7 family putative phage head morphogenesis protein
VGFNDKVKDAVLTQTVNSSRYASHMQKRIDKLWGGMESDLRALIARVNAGEKVSSKTIQKSIAGGKATILAHHAKMESIVAGQLGKFANYTGANLVSRLNDLAGAELFRKTGDLRSLATKTLIVGQPAKEWWKRQTGAAQNKFAQQMRLGVLAGESPAQLTKRLLDGVGSLKINRHQAKALVRTSVASINNAGMMATFQANSDVIDAVEADATLDARTTDICLGRDGGIWDLQTGAPTKDSAVQTSFPGIPPWHMQCRTIMTAVVKPLNELGKKAGLKVDKIPPGTRATMDGQIPESMSTAQWLKSKGDKFGSDLLGKSRYQLWKNGKITLQQLTDQSGRSLNLPQLEKLAGTPSTAQVAKATLPPPKPTAKIEAAKLKQLKAQQKANAKVLKELEADLKKEADAIKAAKIAKAEAKAAKAKAVAEAKAAAAKVKAEAEIAKAKAIAEAKAKAAEIAKQDALLKAAAEKAAKAEAAAKAAAAAKAEAAAIKAAEDAIPEPLKIRDTSKWKKVGPQQGSNPGGMYLDEQGVKWYVKEMTEDRARNELLASFLYEESGIAAAKIRLAKRNGNWAVASKFEEGLKKASIPLLKGPGNKGFAVDAFLANWDVVGLEFDNMLVGPKGVFRVDNGGALKYRAMGSPKGKLFDHKATEWSTMRNPKINPQAAKVFGDMTQAQLDLSVVRLKSIKGKSIDDAVHAVYGTGPEAKDLALLLKRRRLAILEQHAAEFAAGEKAAAEAAAFEAKLAADAAAAKLKIEAAKKVTAAAKAKASVIDDTIAALSKPTKVPDVATPVPGLVTPSTLATGNGPSSKFLMDLDPNLAFMQGMKGKHANLTKKVKALAKAKGNDIPIAQAAVEQARAKFIAAIVKNHGSTQKFEQLAAVYTTSTAVETLTAAQINAKSWEGVMAKHAFQVKQAHLQVKGMVTIAGKAKATAKLTEAVKQFNVAKNQLGAKKAIAAAGGELDAAAIMSKKWEGELHKHGLEVSVTSDLLASSSTKSGIAFYKKKLAEAVDTFNTVLTGKDLVVATKNQTGGVIKSTLTAKRRAEVTKWLEGMTKDTKRGFRSYTGDSYGAMRNVQRGKGSAAANKRYKKQVDGMQKALLQAPKIEETIYRGIRLNPQKFRDAKIVPGGIWSEDAFASWSGQEWTAASFAGKGYADRSPNFHVIFKVKTTRAADVRRLSDHVGENERMMPAKARFRIVDIKRSGKKKNIIEVELEEA